MIVYFFHHHIILFNDGVTSCWIIIYAADINNATEYVVINILSSVPDIIIWFIFVQKIITIQFTCCYEMMSSNSYQYIIVCKILKLVSGLFQLNGVGTE